MSGLGFPLGRGGGAGVLGRARSCIYLVLVRVWQCGYLCGRGGDFCAGRLWRFRGAPERV